jgi:hypothetical protein
MTNTPQKKVREFPVPSRDVTTKLSLGGNNDVITELFLPRGSMVSDIPAGDGKLVNLFLRCRSSEKSNILKPYYCTGYQSSLFITIDNIIGNCIPFTSCIYQPYPKLPLGPVILIKFIRFDLLVLKIYYTPFEHPRQK